MKNHQTKTSLLSYNTKTRYRNKIESEGGISLSFPFSIFFKRTMGSKENLSDEFPF